MAAKLRRNWLIGSLSTTAAIGMTTGALFVVASRVVAELTKPGLTLPDDAPVWGGWRFPSDDPEPPLEFQRPLVFHAPGGPQLRGDFWAQPQTAPTIILSHGFRVPRAKMRSIAALEYRHGCNVLFFDYRGHGDSDLVAVSGGNAEVSDLAAAVDVAARQPETRPGEIFIHGFSMGAAVALLLPPRAEVAGIIADSPYARLDDMLRRIIQAQIRAGMQSWPAIFKQIDHLVPAFTRTVLTCGRLVFRLRFRHELFARPERAIQRWSNHRPGPAPVLIFHTRSDPLIPLSHAEAVVAAARAAGVSVTFVVVNSNVHCGAYGFDPHAYVAALQQFIQQRLEDLRSPHAPC
jgi:alpha-beta hydrolase superfamily lysophospholipase